MNDIELAVNDAAYKLKPQDIESKFENIIRKYLQTQGFTINPRETINLEHEYYGTKNPHIGLCPSESTTDSYDFRPDIIARKDREVKIIEVKKIWPPHWEYYHFGKNLFPKDDLWPENSTHSPIYEPCWRNIKIFTHFNEGQLWNDILRMLNFKNQQKEFNEAKLFIVCFFDNRASYSKSYNSAPINRLKIIIDMLMRELENPMWQDRRCRVFNERENKVNAFSYKQKKHNIQYASSNGFTSGVNFSPSKKTQSFVFEIK